MAKKTETLPPKDRRILKTKKYLAEALKELIIEKGYDAVTIQDIIDRANVGRSTFYTHYESKDQLLVGNINFQEQLIHTPANDPENYPMGINLSYLFNHTKENLDIGNAMAGTRGTEVLSAHFADLVAAKIFDHHRPKLPKNKIVQKMLRYKAEAIAGGIVRMLFKWLEDGAIVPVDEMIVYAKKILDTVG
jgi:AcrR family transcriptional regulator